MPDQRLVIDVTQPGPPRGRWARGDGSADDYFAIQDHINSAPPGSTIYFPAGNYRVGWMGMPSPGLTIGQPGNRWNPPLDGLTICGDGPRSILRYGGSDEKGFVNRSSPILRIWDSSDVTIRDIAFDASRVTPTAFDEVGKLRSFPAVAFLRSPEQHAVFTDPITHEEFSVELPAGPGCKRVRVENTYTALDPFDYWPGEMRQPPPGDLYDNWPLERPAFFFQDCEDIFFRDNIVEDTQLTFSNCKRVHILRNTFVRPVYTAIRIGALDVFDFAGPDENPNELSGGLDEVYVIADNLFEFPWIGAIEVHSDASASASGICISRNRVRRHDSGGQLPMLVSRFGIRVLADEATKVDAVIDGNAIEFDELPSPDTQELALLGQAATGIAIIGPPIEHRSVDRVMIRGNAIAGVRTGTGIKMIRARDAAVLDNTVKDCLVGVQMQAFEFTLTYANSVRARRQGPAYLLEGSLGHNVTGYNVSFPPIDAEAGFVVLEERGGRAPSDIVHRGIVRFDHHYVG